MEGGGEEHNVGPWSNHTCKHVEYNTNAAGN